MFGKGLLPEHPFYTVAQAAFIYIFDYESCYPFGKLIYIVLHWFRNLTLSSYPGRFAVRMFRNNPIHLSG